LPFGESRPFGASLVVQCGPERQRDFGRQRDFEQQRDSERQAKLRTADEAPNGERLTAL